MLANMIDSAVQFFVWTIIIVGILGVFAIRAVAKTDVGKDVAKKAAAHSERQLAWEVLQEVSRTGGTSTPTSNR